jgi:hypothetical protein
VTVRLAGREQQTAGVADPADRTRDVVADESRVGGGPVEPERVGDRVDGVVGEQRVDRHRGRTQRALVVLEEAATRGDQPMLELRDR